MILGISMVSFCFKFLLALTLFEFRVYTGMEIYVVRMRGIYIEVTHYKLQSILTLRFVYLLIS